MSSAPFSLRPYQVQTVEAHEAAWAGQRRPSGEGAVNRTASVLATGLGKTTIFSELIRRRLAAGERAIVLTHREELADQARARLHGDNPGASIGVVKADLDEWDRDIVVASVPTLARRERLERIPADRFGLGVADECHHAASDSWRHVMDYFGAWRGTPWAGFTATMSRGDSRSLGDIWGEIVASYDVRYGIDGGYLVPVKGIRVQVEDLTLDAVRRSRGDYASDDLGSALVDAGTGPAIAQAYLEHCPGRRAALFAPNVHSAESFAADLNDAGVSTKTVFGTTPTSRRHATYEQFRRGETLAISSCMVLTEGWDAPWAEVAIMARPTNLQHLYTQCIGRVLRPFPLGGKTEALVIDVVGVSEKHSLSSLIDLVGAKSDPYGDKAKGAATGKADDVEPEPAMWTPDGRLIVTQVDLFQESDSMWLQTHDGTWFVPTEHLYFFLHPSDDGTFSVGSKRVRSSRRDKAKRLERGLTFEAAAAWAESYATAAELDGAYSIAKRRASWRRKAPSEKLVAFAAQMRIDATGLRQGELSDRVTVAMASRILPKPPRIRNDEGAE